MSSVVTDELVEFEKQLVEVQDFRKITHHFREIYGIYSKLIKKNRKITTSNQLDLETLGFAQLCPKTSPVIAQNLSAPRERGNHRRQAYVSSIQHKNLTPYKFVADSLQTTMSGLI